MEKPSIYVDPNKEALPDYVHGDLSEEDRFGNIVYQLGQRKMNYKGN